MNELIKMEERDGIATVKAREDSLIGLNRELKLMGFKRKKILRFTNL